jgi:hypothetical protein
LRRQCRSSGRKRPEKLLQLITASPQNQANCRGHPEEQEPPEQLKSSFVKLKQKILKLLREILRLIRRPKSQETITIGIMIVAAAASEAAAGTTHA